MKKYRLMSPGPTPVPEKVRLAMAQKIIHHRTPQFKAVVKRVTDKLQKVLYTDNPIYLLAATGTGAMQASVTNMLSRGDKALVINGGKFGARFAKICSCYGVEVVEYELEWGRAADPEKIKNILQNDPEIKAVFATLCETSTGINTDIEAIGKVVGPTDAVLVVDAISGLGADEIKTDEWAVDVFVGGSQKGLMLPPGLAFVSLSEKARALMETSDLPEFYFDLSAAQKSFEKDTTPWTSAVSLINGLDVVLDMMLEEGMDEVLARHAKLAYASREAMKALGLELFSERPSNGVTAVKVPENIDGLKLVGKMRDEQRVNIAGGQAQVKGKIFRLAHLGHMDEYDVVLSIAAIEKVLKQLGYDKPLGLGVRKAQECFFENE